MKAKRLIIQYSACQGLYWMEMATLSGFMAVYLEGVGFQGGQIGMITSAAFIFCIVVQPLLGSFADKLTRLPLKIIPAVMSVLMLVLAAALMFQPPLAVTAVFFILMLILLTCVQPLLNSMCLQFVNAGVKLNFGIARSAGSFGYALTAYFLGSVTKNLGYSVILPVFFIINILLLILLLTFVKPPGSSEANQPEVNRAEEKPLGILTFLAKYPKYTLLMAGFILMLLVHNFLNTYLIYVLREIGGSEQDLGSSLFIAAIVEIPVMSFSGKIMKKINCAGMLRIAAFFYAVKAFAIFSASSASMAVAAQALQFISSAPYIVASVYYVNNTVRRQDCVKAQMIMSVATGICGILANYIGGNLLEVMPVREILLWGSVVGLAGFVVICFATSENAGGRGCGIRYRRRKPQRIE